MHCKDKELAKLLLIGGETKSEIIDRINSAIVYTRDVSDVPANLLVTLKNLSSRLDMIEVEHKTFRDSLHKLLGE